MPPALAQLTLEYSHLGIGQVERARRWHTLGQTGSNYLPCQGEVLLVNCLELLNLAGMFWAEELGQDRLAADHGCMPPLVIAVVKDTAQLMAREGTLFAGLDQRAQISLRGLAADPPPGAPGTELAQVVGPLRQGVQHAAKRFRPVASAPGLYGIHLEQGLHSLSSRTPGSVSLLIRQQSTAHAAITVE